MANSATILGGTVGTSITYHGARVVAVRVIIDTINEDLIIGDPAADDLVALLGMCYGLAGAHNLSFKSASADIVQLIRPASTNTIEQVGKGVILNTVAKGDDLVIQSSVAIPTSVFYIGYYKQIPII